ncbi:MAG: HlyD family efflux transporter periplasmic adaptor subunit [Thermoguttaceae bacterium]|jgi:HlyD family secretion protein
MRLAISVIVIVALVAGGAAYYTKYVNTDPSVNFRTAAVVRDDLLSTIGATGTVEPQESVDVGAQIAGRITELGPDPADPSGKKKVDYCTFMHEGDLLAKIDDLTYKAQLEQAKAGYIKSQADLQQLQAKLLQTEQDLKRADSLKSIKDIPGLDRPIKGIADSDYDLAVANHAMAKANVEVGKAAIIQDKATLDLAERNLTYTIINAPVDGQIIDRRVNVGQTVVSGLSAPSLFLMGKDMHKMQVWASVNEADIGRVRSKPDMNVSFTVDAYSGESFKGKVVQVRYNATSTQNVVVYTVVVEFDNPELKVLPYMTANLSFEVDKRDGVLLVPTTALRWKPKLEQVVPELRDEAASLLAGKSAGGADRSSGRAKSDKPSQNSDERGRVWVQEGKYVRPVEVKIGATDGTQTEVSGDGVKEGMKVVLGVMQDNTLADGGETNPFGPPKFPRRDQNQKKNENQTPKK